MHIHRDSAWCRPTLCCASVKSLLGVCPTPGTRLVYTQEGKVVGKGAYSGTGRLREGADMSVGALNALPVPLSPRLKALAAWATEQTFL